MAEDEVQTILAELRADGLYVHPSAAQLVPAEQQEQIEANLAELREAGAPVYVVVEDVSETGRFGSMDSLLTRVHDRSVTDGDPLEGLYVATDWFYSADYAEREGIAPYTLSDRGWSVSEKLPTDFDALDVNQVEDDLGDGLVLLTESMAARVDGDLTQWDSYIGSVREAREQDRAQEEGSDGAGGTVLLGAGAVLAIVVAGVLLSRRARSGARPGTPERGVRASAQGSRGAAYTLPPSAVELVRAAHDARVVTRGRDELLALGEAVDAAELTPRGDADSWQAALDHYDAARRVLRPEDPADDVPLLDGVGGLVLAQRGRAALAAASRGRAWSPQAPCFLNPLHGPGTTERDVEVGGQRLHAPLCTRCRRDLKRGGKPAILDVMVDGSPRHYFETDARPWADTGFGALVPDLVTALHRARR
ncbi:hypothetical protein RDV89_15680 [Nocardioides zeae]|uniref:Uncharacterized protein n=1 Tax=Nocardioides imazamoxiresistens TaxID=3231893 RepID=A0ABU3Q0I6_9ACTN|nr:hypothetical protein [Nocardioides zeae]MDT9594525.1 hypothetical protein [Nocardioides zeae]